MGRVRSGALSTFAVGLMVLAACNAMTGAGDLGTEEPGLGGPESAVPTATATSSTPAPASPGSDASAPSNDAAATDGASAIPDAIADAPTVVPDVGPGCTPGNTGMRFGTDANGEKWTDKSGALAPRDDRWAHTNSDNANALVITGYRFSIPATAQITGITVEIHRTAEGREVRDGSVRLTKGSSKANGVWPERAPNDPFVATTYGGAADLWGAAWTPADFANLSVALVANGSGDGHVDAVGVTVHYCPPP